MVCNVSTLALLLCCLVLSLADVASNTETETADETSNGEVTENDTETDNKSWSCPDGWVAHVSDREISCLQLDRKAKSFSNALINCRNLGGGLVTFSASNKETFVKGLTKTGDGGEYWVGLSKDRGYDAGFDWHTLDDIVPADTDILPQSMRDYLSYKAQCAFISSFNEELDMDDCDTEYFAICEQKISCKPGYFGDKCERECHCAGEPCNLKNVPESESVTCKWGCQRNWMGAACDTEKQDPEVKYFCINSPGERGKYVHIRINTKALIYRAIYGLNAKKARGDWCNSTTLDSSSNDMTVIRIFVTEDSIDQMSAGRCVGEKIGDNIFSWAIVIKENEGILLEHDLLSNITCDFNNAESLVRSDKYSLTGEPLHVHQIKFTPESINHDVTLQVINAYSGEQVSEATIGLAVILQMKFGLQQGSLLKGVFPYNCEASTPDGKHVKKLLDANGCQVQTSPVYPFVPTNVSQIVTPWFNLFAFEDEQSVTFSCSFDLCLTSICKVGCWNSSRHERDTRDRNEVVQHATTRTIRILSNFPSQTTSGNNHNPEYQSDPAPASSRYDVGPFVYLNPVTCTLFLLILLIFVCMYITFLRTLRKSVYDIRKEIEVKRSRDQFLHCGCVQQKDRDYIQA